MSKNLSLVIVGHQGYIRHVENEKDYALENDILFNSISRTYLPLVNLFHKLEEEGVKFKLSMVFSPSLCSLLDDSVVQQQYVAWLEKRIAFGEAELNRCKGDSALLNNAQIELAKAKKDLSDFTEVYGQNILVQFAKFAQKGYLELLATCGTYAFLPHYGDMTEILNAQVEVGLCSHRHYFGSNPDGFYLPFMGYTIGIEKVLKSYGIKYTIVDFRSLLFSETLPENGIFSPVRCAVNEDGAISGTPLSLFAQDSDSPEDVIEFVSNEIYKNQSKDPGFELSSDELAGAGFIEPGSARIPTGFRYWAKSENVYNFEKALAQVKLDAENFVKAKAEKLSAAEKCMKEGNPGLVCVLDAKLFGQDWAEGVDFLENVLRTAADSDISLSDCSSQLSNIYILQKITPYPGAAQGNSYGEDLLEVSNDWMLRYTRKMSERMIDLSDRYPNETGLKIRLLNLGARELMLAQSGEWASMIHDGNFPEYAVKRFKESIKSFMIVFDALGTNTVSTEWLTKLEREHTIFPWMNFRIFSKKV
ncbi:MAG: DUF1957 domain-containing protein [Treponema sp.]|nr:DUF1957 domain-containing protein [Candidatus Treponema equifaecale]